MGIEVDFPIVSGRLFFTSLFFPKFGPDRRQDDVLETGWTQLHPVLSDRCAGRAEKPEARPQGRGRQEGGRDDQDEEVGRRKARGICETPSVRLALREPEPSALARRWLRWRTSGRTCVDC